jgi:hypothetical protein
MRTAGIGFLAALLTVATAFAQQPPKADDKKDPQQQFEPKSAPGEGQKFLAKMAGEFSVAKTFYPRTPGAEPTKTNGSCKQEMVHDNHFLRSEFTFDAPSGKTTGTGVIGFEPGNGKFTSTWFDSRQTRMSFRQSKDKFDGTKIVLYGVSFEEAKDGRRSKTVTHLEDNGNKVIHRQFSIAADGTERIVMQLEMTRKADKPTGR